MTDMQRWGMEYERGEWDIAPDPEGAYVLLAEAKAAINAARRDMLAQCIAAVEMLSAEMRNWSSVETEAVLSVHPGLTAEQWVWAQIGVDRAAAAINELKQTNDQG
jgi:hypothetical protein